MKKNNEIVRLEKKLRHLKSITNKDRDAVYEIEETKREIRELKKNKDGK